jgi:flagellar biogenesis protein FliO
LSSSLGPVASYLVETSVTLLGLILVVAIFLYGAKRRGIGRAMGPLELLGRLPLEDRRAVYLVRVGGSVYVIAGSEAGLTKIGELTESELGPLPDPARGALADVIRRALGGIRRTEAAVSKDEGEHAD